MAAASGLLMRVATPVPKAQGLPSRHVGLVGDEGPEDKQSRLLIYLSLSLEYRMKRFQLFAVNHTC